MKITEYDNGYYVLHVTDEYRYETPYLFETMDELELTIEDREGNLISTMNYENLLQLTSIFSDVEKFLSQSQN